MQQSLLLCELLCSTGLPNQPKIGDITFSDGTITVSWTLSRDDLRPIEKYTIIIRITGSRGKRQANEDGLHQIDVNLADIQCKFDQSLMIDHCEYSVQQEVRKGKTYNITLCAKNEFGKTCQSSGSIIPPEVVPTAALVTGGGLPIGIIVGIVISVLVAVLLFSLLFVSIAILKRRNERKEMDQEDNDSERLILIKYALLIHGQLQGTGTLFGSAFCYTVGRFLIAWFNDCDGRPRTILLWYTHMFMLANLLIANTGNTRIHN